jgi:hypothetical protein
VDAREREAFPLEWDNAMDLLEDVDAIAEQRMLRRATRQRLRAAADELLGLLPVIEHLRLRVPDPEALARLAGRPTSLPTA